MKKKLYADEYTLQRFSIPLPTLASEQKSTLFQNAMHLFVFNNYIKDKTNYLITFQFLLRC